MFAVDVAVLAVLAVLVVLVVDMLFLMQWKTAAPTASRGLSTPLRCSTLLSKVSEVLTKFERNFCTTYFAV